MKASDWFIFQPVYCACVKMTSHVGKYETSYWSDLTSKTKNLCLAVTNLKVSADAAKKINNKIYIYLFKIMCLRPIHLAPGYSQCFCALPAQLPLLMAFSRFARKSSVYVNSVWNVTGERVPRFRCLMLVWIQITIDQSGSWSNCRWIRDETRWAQEEAKCTVQEETWRHSRND